MPSPSMKRTLAVVVAVAILAVTASSATAASTARGPYILTERMESSLQEYGLTWGGRNHAVLYTGCVGQGLPGPKRADQAGLKWPTYRKFLCMVTVRKAKNVDMIHVETLPGGRWTWETV